MPVETIGTPLMWSGFIGFVLAMLALDLGVFHKQAHQVGMREAATWSAVWVGLAAVFNAGVYFCARSSSSRVAPSCRPSAGPSTSSGPSWPSPG